jgi:hypothetical protein
MKWTMCLALVLTVVAGLLVGCSTAPASRAEQNTLLAEAESTRQQMRAEDPALGEYGVAVVVRPIGGQQFAYQGK